MKKEHVILTDADRTELIQLLSKGSLKALSFKRAKITALATSDVPEGYSRWSSRLLAEKIVESGICDEISYSTVQKILKKRTETALETNPVHWYD